MTEFCPECERNHHRAEAEHRRAETILVDLENAHVDLTVKRRQIAQLKADISKLADEDPANNAIREVLEHWRQQTGHQKAKIPMDGKRAKLVRAALRHRFKVEDLKLAVDGAKRLPFVGPHGRTAVEGPGCKRFDDCELIFRDETTIERFQGYARRTEEAAAVPAPAASPRRYATLTLDPIDKVLQALRDLDLTYRPAGGDRDAWMAQCPAHDDRSPSLSIRREPPCLTDDGKVLLNCFAGCHTMDIVIRLGLAMSDLFYPSAERGMAA